MVREVLRKQAVLRATGWSNTALYAAISAGKFPKPVKWDPDSRMSIWFADEVAEFQQGAVERSASTPMRNCIRRGV
jgi:prophage regulatory protein